MRNPCERCRKVLKCTEICEKLSRLLPKVDQGSNSREISVDPARFEKYGENIEIRGLSPDVATEKWLRGRS